MTLARFVVLIVFCLMLAACEPATQVVIPTDPPTITPTFTPSPTHTPGGASSPTPFVTRPALINGATPTSLFGATRTPIPRDFPTATRIFNPNAPQIEFFTSDPLTITPGESVTLFWSARNIDSASIYRIDETGNRTQVFNVAPDGSLNVDTRSSERGLLTFELALGEGQDATEARIEIPLQCPVEWFFATSLDECASAAPTETLIYDQEMERGRMLYVEASDTVYVLFNDGGEPAWSSFANRYNPEIHAERDPNAPPNFIQPLAELGFVWRGNDTVRNRLGLGLSEAIIFDGFTQTAPASGSGQILYISGANGVVLQLIPGNDLWQIIGASS